LSDEKFLSYDLGTTATKAVLVSNEMELIDSAVEEFTTLYPEQGYAEHDPNDWWRTLISTTKTVLEKTHTQADEITALTFCSQTQGLLPVDENGSPLMNCMIWLDSRGAEYLHKVYPWPRVLGYSPLRIWKFLRITGGAPGLTGKDQIPKILWLRDKHPEIYEKCYKYLDVKDYIIFRLTGKMVTSTDLAYLYWLVDTRKKDGKPRNEWSKSLCKTYDIDMNRLPEIRKPTDIIGHLTDEAASVLGLSKKTQIVCGIGDMPAAAIGSGAILEGELHCQIGTSGWVLGHVSERKVDISHYTGCTGSAFPDQFYLITAHQEIAGAALEWVKNSILYFKEELQEKVKKQVYEIFDELVAQCEPGAKGKGGTHLLFMPWLFGERCPLDDDHVRAGLINVSLDHDRRHLLRSIFEGVAFNAKWALEIVEKMYSPVECLHIVGGGAKSDVWCQIYADVMNRRILRVKWPQVAGAIGAAIIAKMALEELNDPAKIKDFIYIDKEFHPNPEYRLLYNHLFKEFKNLYKQNKKWFRRMNTR